MLRFARYSSMFRKDTASLLTEITTTYHIIEKGLSFRDSRSGFGKEMIENLIALLSLYENKGGDRFDRQYVASLKVLQAYLTNQPPKGDKDCSFSTVDIIYEFLEKRRAFNASGDCDVQGGCKEITKDDYTRFGKGDFALLSQNRYSIRTFSEEDIPVQVLRDVIKYAQKTPSTCNRQTARAYLVSDKQKIMEVLRIHKGTRGFSEYINKLILVAGDLRACMGTGDRNQVFVDCGLFAMNILYGLQYKGIGACILHWSVDAKKDKILRKFINLDIHHTVVCLIAIGGLDKRFKVPISQRNSLESILIET